MATLREGTLIINEVISIEPLGHQSPAGGPAYIKIKDPTGTSVVLNVSDVERMRAVIRAERERKA